MGAAAIVELILTIMERGLPIAKDLREFIHGNPDATIPEVMVEIHRISPAYKYREHKDADKTP